MKEAGKVRVGVLGVGSIAQVVHLPILSNLPSVSLAGVADLDRSKAKAIGARFRIPQVFQTDDEILRADDIDAVVICTPNHLHEQQAIAALQAGKHVLVEKPLAMSADGAERVIRAAEAAGRTLQVAMNNRFRPDSLALKPFADGGELGEIFLARGAWLNRKMRMVRPTWRHRRATAGGGALIDLGVQTLDLALWFLGPSRVESVVAHLHHPAGLEVEDSAAVLVRLANGGGISLTVSWSLVAERDRHYMRLLGTRGSGAISPLAVFKELDNGMMDVTPQLPAHRENLYTVSYRNELQHFIAAATGQAPAPLPHEQVQIMKIVELGYRSGLEKREVAWGDG